jgi:hypothetical protein
MKTVIVLGAGASGSAGFPVGSKLVEQIAKLYQDASFIEILKRILWNNRETLRKKYSNLLPSTILDHIENDCGSFFRDDIPELYEWIHNLPSADTIDDFIYYRPEFSVFAKLGILNVLGDYENGNFFDPDPDGTIKNIWYNAFWKYLRYNCITADDLTKKLNRLTIITFNYDRSFDYFLSRQIYSLYKHSLNDSDSRRALKIHHVYGSIGDLLNSGVGISRGYEPINFIEPPDNSSPFYMNSWNNYVYLPEETDRFNKFDKYILSLSMGIKTYNEEFITESQIKYIDIIQSATHLYFLGFAFHPQNMNILFPGYEVRGNSLELISGTCYKMSPTDFDRAKNRLQVTYGIKLETMMNNIGKSTRKVDIDMFLHDTGIEI